MNCLPAKTIILVTEKTKITQNLDLIFYSHPLTYFVVWILATRNLIYGLSYFNKFSYLYALLTVLIPAGIAELIRLIL